MSKRLVTTIFAAVVAAGLGAVPAHAAPQTDLAKPLGWEWGSTATPLGWEWGSTATPLGWEWGSH